MLTQLRRLWQMRQLPKNSPYLAMFVDHPEECVSLDCETTSLKIADAELLSIGAVKIRGMRIINSQSFYVLVRPEKTLRADNICIHGLRPCDLSEGLIAAQAVQQLIDFIGGRALVGYYLSYDVAVLNRYVKALTGGIGLVQRKIEVSALYYDHKITKNPGAYVDLRWASICEDLAIPALPRHDALNDALTAAMLYLKLKHLGFSR